MCRIDPAVGAVGSRMIEIVTVFFALACVLLLICGGVALQANPRSGINRSMLAICVLLALSNAGQAVVYSAHSLSVCAFWYRFSWIGWAFYPAVAVQFALEITEHVRRFRHRGYLAALYLPAAIFFLRSQLSLLGLSGFAPTATGTFLPIHAYGAWDVAYPIYQYGADLLTLGMVGVWGFTSGSHRKRKQAEMILGTALLALVIDAAHYALGTHGELRALWAIEQVIFAFGLSFAVAYQKFTVPSPAVAAHYIVSHVKELVVLTSTSGTILQVNAATLALLQTTEKALVGRSFPSLIAVGTFVAWPYGVGEQGLPPVHEVYLHRKGGTPLPVALTRSAIKDAYGDVIGVIIVGEDLRRTRQLEQEIAERTRAEERLTKADRAKDDFLAVLSHELLTPLSTIVLWNALAKNDPSVVPKALEVIEQNARHQQRVVEDLLDVSRLIHGKLTLKLADIDLQRLTVQCIEEYQHRADERGVRLALHQHVPHLPLRVDPDRLRQVIGNLLKNAVRCTPADGCVEVTTTCRDGMATLTVRDTGCGIPAEQQASIFTPFHQGAQRESTGMLGVGLVVVKGIVELHGGTVSVYSAGKGQGSTFTIELPMTPMGAPDDLAPVVAGAART